MDKFRGRARGRAQDTRKPSSSTRPGGNGKAKPGPSRGPPPEVQSTSAWGPPSQVQPPVQSTSAWGPPSQVQEQQRPRAAAPQSQIQAGGRATHRGGGDASGPSPGAEKPVVGEISEGGEVGAMHSGRGALRGRRRIQGETLRTRPEQVVSKLGSHGQPVRLSGNYFQLLKTTSWCLYQYRVDFLPEEDSTPKKKYLLRVGIKNVLPGYIFDGTLLFTSHRLNPDPMEVTVKSDRGDETIYHISIRLVGTVEAGEYQYLQIFNMIMRKCMAHLKLQLVGRNYYDPDAKVDISDHHLQLWPGYITSIRQHENSILMCCEVIHKVIRTDTALELLQECSQYDRANFRKKFAEGIVGTIVLTDYNNRTYRVDDVDFSLTPQSTFPMRDGSSVSYIQYYAQKYNIAIRDSKQPLLVSKSKPREIRAGMAETIYLIPELCRMTGLTDAQRSHFHLMRAVSEHTRVGPGPRIEKLMNFNRRLMSKPEIVNELCQWDMKLATTLINFSGRVLPPEEVCSQSEIKYSAGRDADWTRELRSRPLLHAPDMGLWIALCPSKFKDSAYSFMKLLLKAAGGMKWRLPMPKLYDIKDDRPGTYVTALENIIADIKPMLILCVVSNNKSDRYSLIKKKCCIDAAVPTQVIIAKNLDSKGAMSIATKVAIQLNCKIGGAPWTVPIQYKSIMVVGFDVCHDPKQNRSFGAMVSSLNTSCSQYFSVVTPHSTGEELSRDIPLNMVKACQEWGRHNGRLPEKILFYRDGVGEGQLPFVYQIEVQTILRQLKELLYKENEVKLCFIVVSKRINTRIFTSNGTNPPPGTVVDDVITLPERYDFFIVSQCVRQGTVSPTSYNIIYDSMGNSADQLQRTTYKLTHMYYNWSGTVRVPAPCQYAHKLALLTSQALFKEPNPGLSKTLFYL